MMLSHRTLFPALIPTLTCCLCLLFAAAPAHTADNQPPGVGSDLVLHTVWSDVELVSQPTEKWITYQDAPDLTPPAYTEPKSPLAPLAPELRGSIRSVDVAAGSPVAKPVALTFDLCERSDETTGYDGAIVDWLRANRVSATFFAGGKWMRSHPERTMQLMADPLFELGNHGWTHGNLRVMTGKKMRDQVLWTQVQYEVLRAELARRHAAQAGDSAKARAAMAAVPQALRTLRFPFGACSDETLEFLAQSGLPAIQWDVVTADPAKSQNADGIARIVRDQAKPGSIIICHANGRGHGTLESLAKFIPALQKQGYTFVTVSHLLALGTPRAASTCYEVKPGDNLIYDKLFGEGTTHAK